MSCLYTRSVAAAMVMVAGGEWHVRVGAVDGEWDDPVELDGKAEPIPAA